MARTAHYAVLIAVGLGLPILFVALALPALRERIRPALLEFALENLSDTERDRIYAEIANRGGTIWEAVPEALVGRIARPGAETTIARANVRINKAGMRSSKAFARKPANVFRIACLGDSFVFGTAGAEEVASATSSSNSTPEKGSTQAAGPSRPTPWASGVGRRSSRRPISRVASRPSTRT